MSTFCSVCNELKEQVLVFPCSDQHKACRQCLQALTIEMGSAVKCPECRQLFGKVDLDLWKVEGGEIPAQQICTSCSGEGQLIISVQICIECDQKFCEDCFKSHEKVFRGTRSHTTIPFDEYRVTSDKFTKWQCGIHDVSATEFCTNCEMIGCVFCKRSGRCADEKHTFVTLAIKCKLTSVVVSNEIDATQAASIVADDKLKGLLQSMEDYRVEITGRRSELQAHVDAKIQLLKAEHGKLDRRFESCLQRKAKQVEAERVRLLEKISSLQSLQDGLGALLTTYHPARLVESEEPIKRRVQEETALRELEVDFTSPLLVQTADVCAKELLGLKLATLTSEETKSVGAEAPPEDRVGLLDDCLIERTKAIKPSPDVCAIELPATQTSDEIKSVDAEAPPEHSIETKRIKGVCEKKQLGLKPATLTPEETKSVGAEATPEEPIGADCINTIKPSPGLKLGASHLNDNRFKVILLGADVGKTSLFLRFKEDKFNNFTPSTIGADFLHKKLEIDGIPIRLELWDTPGAERYHSLTACHCRGIQGAIVVYDITCKESFDKVIMWVEELKMMLRTSIELCIVGNKIDMEKKRCIQLSFAQQYAESVGASYHQTSAELNEGVEELFLDISQRMIKRRQLKEESEEVNTEEIKTNEPMSKEKKNNCRVS